MKVTFEVDSTPLEDYLFIFDLVTELWLGQIMSSENAIFVKNGILTSNFYPVERLKTLIKIILHLQLPKSSKVRKIFLTRPLFLMENELKSL